MTLEIIRKRGKKRNYFILVDYVRPNLPVMLGRFRNRIAAKKAKERYR